MSLAVVLLLSLAVALPKIAAAQETTPPPNDNFAGAQSVTVGADYFLQAYGATTEAGEPLCDQWLPSVWYRYDSAAAQNLVARTTNTYWYSYSVAVYTGASLGSLQRVGCQTLYAYSLPRGLLFAAAPGVTYYIQVQIPPDMMASPSFRLEQAQMPYASFYAYPYDPSRYDTVTFSSYATDPEGIGIATYAWSFGDGATAAGSASATHRYAADGAYSVSLTITTPDGRAATVTQAITVATYDVAIAKFGAPQSASAGQTRQISVGVSAKSYTGEVRVDLYRSGTASSPYPAPGPGWTPVGSLTQYLTARPNGRATDFAFSYTFTPDDAALGKVSFMAVATLVGRRDALPADNQAISLPTKVNR